jgi:hypothetical protein
MSINDRDENLQFLNAVRNVDKTYHEPPLKRVAPKQIAPRRVHTLELYSPNEWVAVVIKKDCKEPPYGMLELELPNKRTVLCSRKAITKSPGDHKSCLTCGTVGTAKVGRTNGEYFATEARFEGDPPNKEEIGRVAIWRDDKKQGFVERPCGDWLFIAGTRRREAIEIGDWVQFTMKRSKNPKYTDGYVGMNARKIIAPFGARR